MMMFHSTSSTLQYMFFFGFEQQQDRQNKLLKKRILVKIPLNLRELDFKNGILEKNIFIYVTVSFKSKKCLNIASFR